MVVRLYFLGATEPGDARQPKWPWHPISEDDARTVIDNIRARGPDLVALSGDDSTQWTIDAFGQVFGDRYRTLRVGEEIVIAAA